MTQFSAHYSTQFSWAQIRNNKQQNSIPHKSTHITLTSRKLDSRSRKEKVLSSIASHMEAMADLINKRFLCTSIDHTKSKLCRVSTAGGSKRVYVDHLSSNSGQNSSASEKSRALPISKWAREAEIKEGSRILRRPVTRWPGNSTEQREKGDLTGPVHLPLSRHRNLIPQMGAENLKKGFLLFTIVLGYCVDA